MMNPYVVLASGEIIGVYYPDDLGGPLTALNAALARAREWTNSFNEPTAVRHTTTTVAEYNTKESA
jgi:trans-aconitate methyltransferase